MLGWIKERRARKLEQQAERVKQDFTELKEELALKNHAALILGKAMFGDPAGPVESPGALIDEGDENFERIELGRKFRCSRPLPLRPTAQRLYPMAAQTLTEFHANAF